MATAELSEHTGHTGQGEHAGADRWVAAEIISPFAAAGYRPVAEAAGELAGEAPAAELPAGEIPAAELSAVTPFAHAGAGEGREVVVGEILAELNEAELAEALGELAQEWSAVHAEVSSGGGVGVTPGGLREADAVLGRHAGELTAEVERYLETLAEQLGEHTAATIGERELAAFHELTEAPPVPAGASPAQEQFFGAIGRAIGGAVRGAVNLAGRGLSFVHRIATAPLRLLAAGLKKLAGPLLRRVLTWAIGRLPPSFRPLANQLRIRMFGAETAGEQEVTGELTTGEHGGWTGEQELLAELAGELTWRSEIPAVAGAGELAQEFAHLVANHLVAEDEAELEQLEAEFAATTAEHEAAPGAAELDAARVVLVRELAALRPGESAAPAVERFLPAVWGALKIGVGLIGRRNVVNFLAKLVGELIKPLLGPQLATPLSQVVVDTGLRWVGLEAEDRELAGATAVTALVEDTVRRVAEQGSEVFADVNRLHTETVAAFHEAVAAAVPGSLVRPDLAARETAGTDAAAWLLRPRVYWYRKYSRVFEVRLTPTTAAAVTTFGGVRLADVLRAQGVRLPVRARVHLYETLPGTFLSRISQLERGVPGMGRDGWRRFHPLSITNAGVLLGEPGLGRDVDGRFTRDRSHVAAGQRFFFVQLPGGGGGGGGVGVRRPTQAFVTIDARPAQNAARLLIYLSEPDTQALASRVRQRNTTAFVIALRDAVKAAVYSLRHDPRSRVTIRREVAGEAPAAAAGAAAGIAGKIVEKIVDRLADAALRLAADYARAKGDEFVAAADRRANGVTVVFTVPLPGLSTLFTGLSPLAVVSVARSLLAAVLTSRAGITTLPGFRRF